MYIRQVNKKERKLNTTVKYEIREFIYGRIDYVTDCPFGEYGRYTSRINKVGALECNRCVHQLKNNTYNMVVRCTYPTPKK